MQRLLEAALLKEPQALVSWKTYLAQNDLQTIDHAAIALLPLVYRNLKELSHPLCKSAYRHTWVSNQTLWRKTLPTLHRLLDAGIQKIVLLKGMGLILHHYRDFGVRTLGDIDILIDRSQVPLAHSLLLASGWECTLSRFDPQNSHQLARWHAANFTHPSGLHLDVHWSLLLESNEIIDREVLRAVPLGITPASPTHLFFQTCVHGNKKSTAPLIRWIPDALTLLKSPIDFPHLFRLAQLSHLTLPFSSALSYLSHHFDVCIPPFRPQPSRLEMLEFKANLRGRIYLAAYYRARLRKHSILDYLQHTANLPSRWYIPLYAPFWLLKRLYRLPAKIKWNCSCFSNWFSNLRCSFLKRATHSSSRSGVKQSVRGNLDR